MRYKADGGENFVGVVLCDALSQRPIDFVNSGCVPVCEKFRGRLWCFGEEDDAGSGSAQAVDRVCVRGLLLHQAQEGVFHEAAPGEGGQPARFVDGQQMRVIKQDFEVPRRVWFDPGRTVPDNGLARSEQFASGDGDAVDGDFAVVQFLLPGLWDGVRVKACQVEEQRLSMVFAAYDCGVGIAPVEHVSLSVG